MKRLPFVSMHAVLRLDFRLARVFLVPTMLVFIAGCGGGGTTSSGGSGTPLSGNTSVTVLATSAANDQLQMFAMEIKGITLTSQSGKTVPLLSNSLYPEFMHVNGSVEPLATATIPEDIYTAANVTLGGADFTCVSLNSSGGLQTSSYAYGQTPAANVTVRVPTPITVSGSAMGLAFNLLVSQSASFGGCANGFGDPYSITPTFSVTPVVLADKPTNSSNGLAEGLQGLISAVDSGGSTFTVTDPDSSIGEGASWQVFTNSSTVFQGISGAAQLVAGMPVDMDTAIQSDGTLLATRVAVYDNDPTTLTYVRGPLAQIAAEQPTLFATGVEGQGYLLGGGIGTWAYNFANADFQISGSATNLQSLPFAAVFSATNLVPGQRVSITTHATAIAPGPTYEPAATMTLLPQTIDGVVSAISSSGAFTTYTVGLASYDLFPVLAVQGGQASLLTDPNTVVVYADVNTRRLNSAPVTAGRVVRFKGLVFNDNGTLRMDCMQINDGVTE
jgi:Domain of unknown function (DUF5666)